ncbi:MAG: hypothetical protein R8G66_02830 [Cytophagales bacterium]|nr:hypothetical protein [Cytophagales bacterium]
MRKEQRLYGNDIRILKELFDLALQEYGISDKGILEVSSEVKSKLRDSINDYAVLNKKKAEEFDVELQVSVNRTYAIYISKIQAAIKRAGGIDKLETLVKESDDGVAYSYPIINTLTAFATQGKFFEWEDYRSKKIEERLNFTQIEEIQLKKTEEKSSVISTNSKHEQTNEEKETKDEKPKPRRLKLHVILPAIVIFMNLISYLVDGVDFINWIEGLLQSDKVKNEWLKGEVKSNGILITDATAKLGHLSATTDSLGKFEFRVPNPKKDSFYLLEVRKTGFKAYSFSYMLDDDFINTIQIEPIDSISK